MGGKGDGIEERIERKREVYKKRTEGEGRKVVGEEWRDGEKRWREVMNGAGLKERSGRVMYTEGRKGGKEGQMEGWRGEREHELGQRAVQESPLPPNSASRPINIV